MLQRNAAENFRREAVCETAQRAASILLGAWITLLGASSTTVWADQTAPQFDASNARLVDTGFKIWMQEKFNGNGRTCGTCHIPEHDYAISPADIAALSTADRKLVLGGTNTSLENPTLVNRFALFNINDSTPGEVGNTTTPVGPFRTSMLIGGLFLTTLNECPDATLIAAATTTGVPTAQITTVTPPLFPFVVGERINITAVQVRSWRAGLDRLSH